MESKYNYNAPKNPPIIDWDMCLKLANHDPAIAEELLGVLIKTLPKELDQIIKAESALNYKFLSQHLHKLRGALCYCGVPRLRLSVSQLETAVKNQNNNEISTLLPLLKKDVFDLLSEATKFCN